MRNRLDHSNDFHEALNKVHDIAKNGCRNTQAWQDILEIVDSALDTARKADAEVERKWPLSPTMRPRRISRQGNRVTPANAALMEKTKCDQE